MGFKYKQISRWSQKVFLEEKGSRPGKGWSLGKHTFPSLMLLGARNNLFVLVLIFKCLCERQPSESYLLGRPSDSDQLEVISWAVIPQSLWPSVQRQQSCYSSLVKCWTGGRQVWYTAGALDPQTPGSVVSQGYTRVWICFCVGRLKNKFFREDVCMCPFSE